MDSYKHIRKERIQEGMKKMETDKYTSLNASWIDTLADGTKNRARLTYDIGKNLDQHTVDEFKHALYELEARLSPDIPLRISVNTYVV